MCYLADFHYTFFEENIYFARIIFYVNWEGKILLKSQDVTMTQLLCYELLVTKGTKYLSKSGNNHVHTGHVMDGCSFPSCR